MLKDNYTVVNIRDYFSNNHTEVTGEQVLNTLLSSFSCPLNFNVETFLKENAVEFTKKNQSVTYLVFSKDDAMLVGYFTLAIKPVTVNSTVISNTVRKKLLRVGKVDADKQELYLSAYLIAQLGKNYTNDANTKITGQQLLEIAIDEIKETQFKVGGMAVFLEAENNRKLLGFYGKENNFKEFGVREPDLVEGDKEPLVQMLRLL